MASNELIHRSDFLRAYMRFKEVCDDDYHFEDFLEAPLLLRRVKYDTHEYFNVTGNTRRQLHVLLGSHYRTIIKAWLVS